MPQFFLKLFCSKRSINSFTVLVEDGICTGRSWLSRSRARVHPHETDQTRDEKHRSKPAADEPRPQYQPQDQFHYKVQVRMLHVLPGSES